MGLLGDVLGIFGVSSTNKTNKQINSTNNEFNAKQAQIARDWQEEQYNKYSSPSAMVQQYEDAGLNPALAYSGGQGNTFTGSTASASSPIAMQNPLSGDFDISSIVSLIDNLKNTKSQRNLQKEQSETEQAKQDNLAASTQGLTIENQFKPDLLKQNLKQGMLNLENTKQAINLAKSQTLLNYDSLLSTSLNRIFTAKQIENIGIKNLKDTIDIGLDVLKTLTEVDESRARVSEIKERVLEQQWINRMIDEHNINPRYAGQYWQTLLQCLEGLSDIDSKTKDYYDKVEKGEIKTGPRDNGSILGDYGRKQASKYNNIIYR